MSPAHLEALARIEKWLRWREEAAAGVNTPPADRLPLRHEDVRLLQLLVLSRRQVGAVWHGEVVVRLADDLNEEGWGRASDRLAEVDMEEEVRTFLLDKLADTLPASLVEIGPFDVTVSEVPAS